MILGIDASNLRGGGGITHLTNFLRSAKPEKFDIHRVIVWGGRNPLEKLPKFSWLDLREKETLNHSRMKRLVWQFFHIDKLAKQSGCNLLFVPGGLFLGDFRPYVALCQNLLPFEFKEVMRYGVSTETVRLRMLRLGQSRTFIRSNGNIFLSHYAKQVMTDSFSSLKDVPNNVIPHGVDASFVKNQQKTKKFSKAIKMLYVSSVEFYKHQWNVVSAVSSLRKEGFDVKLTLIGPAFTPALNKLRAVIDEVDPNGHYIKYEGSIDYTELPSYYQKTDIFVFASTCENLPIILLEAMASHLPIACSDKNPMPESLKDAGLYFNSESVSSIKDCLKFLIENPNLRQNLGAKAGQYSQATSWEKCADETFSFLRQVYDNK